MKQSYNWNPDTYMAQCILTDGENEFVGVAVACPEDQDYANQYTGLQIAEQRAIIKALKHRKNFILRPTLKGLNQLYYSMKHSTKFNPKSYEAKMLFRQINIAKDDLEATEEMIEVAEEMLRDFINKKDITYKRLREKNKKNHQITIGDILDETV